MPHVPKTIDAADQHETPQARTLGTSPAADLASNQIGGSHSDVFSASFGEPPVDGTTRLFRNPTLSHSANGPVRSVVFKRVQQTLGNHFVQRLVSLASPTPSASQLIQCQCTCGATCEKCSVASAPSHTETPDVAGRATYFSAARYAPQAARMPEAAAKNAGGVVVGDANDPMEHEADLVAQASTHPSPLRRMAQSAASLPTASAPSLQPPESGSPLPGNVREKLEGLLEADLGQVRVHDSALANEASVSINAKAFTQSNDIYLGPGQSPNDMALLAHEATHVVQQRGAPSLGVQRDPNDPSPSGLPLVVLGGDIQGFILGNTRGIHGPLPAAQLIEEDELRVWQKDLHHVEINYAHSWVTIKSKPGQVYEYFVEQTRSRAPATPTFEPSGLLYLGVPDQPPPQVAVRIAATIDVDIDKFQDEREGEPQLAVHQRFAGADDIATGPLFGEVREHWVGQSAVISVDESAIKITPPSERNDLNPQNFPDAKFAFWIDPVWTGPEYREKKVSIVASPGVGLEEGTPGMFNPAYSYDRKIIPELMRVPHPAMVPAQGTPISPGEFVGYQRLTPGENPQFPVVQPEPTSEDLVVTTSFSGVTIAHPYSGSKVGLAPTDRSVGAAYAYQVMPMEGGHPGEIRVVVGPGVFISVEEPAPQSWRQRFGSDTPPDPGEHPSWFGSIRGPEYLEGLKDEGVEVNIIEVSFADQVPLQGTPLNLNALPGSRRQPDSHQWIDTSDLASTVATTTFDVSVGMIPIVGDLVDIAEFVWALANDNDRWGRRVSTFDKVVMGIGAIIGLIPFLGGVGSLLRGGGRASVKIAEAAARVGKNADELELILWQLRGAVKGDDAIAIDNFIRAANRGEDIAVEEVEKLQGLLGRVGAGGLAPTRVASHTGPVILDIRHLGLEPLAEASDWRRSLNAETRAYLQSTPEVSRVYEQMDEGVRLVLTKCASFCLPPVPPTPAQQAAIKRLLIVADPGLDDTQLIRTFLHQASDLDNAILQLSEIATPTKLRRFLRRHVDMADAALLAREAWRVDPAFQVMREKARTLVRNGMSVDQLGKIMGQAARSGEEGPEFLNLVQRLWHKQPRPAGTEDLLNHLAAGGTGYRNSEWMLRYFERGRVWDGLEALDFSGGRWAAQVNGQTIQFRSWQRFESEEFISQMAADYSSGRTATKWVFEPGSPLGSAENIQAAGEQALRDALRRGDPRVTEEMVDFVASNLARTIDVPAARQFTRLDVERVRSALSALEQQFPILRELHLDVSSLQRVMAKGPDINLMKGQLLEELMAVSVRQSLASPAGRRALGLAGVQGELVFIEGHRISLAGRQFTDGVVAVRRGDKLEILVIFEAKSGQGSTGGLVSSVQTVRSMKDADKLELFNYIRDEMPEQLQRYLAEHHPSTLSTFRMIQDEGPRLVVSRGTVEMQQAALNKIPSDVLVDVATTPEFRRSAEGWIKTTELGGQVRRDVERAYEAFGTSPAGRQRGGVIKIDGQEAEAILRPSRVQFKGVVPNDVDTDYIEKTLTGLGYRFESEGMSIAGQDLIDLTEALNAQLRPRNP